ncbi:MAG: dTMP kinase [Calditrichaceae bacterium]
MSGKLLLAIEGIDGSGKTTTARLLAEKLGFEYIKTPSEKYQKMRAFYEGPETNMFSRFLFYLGAVKDTVDEALKTTTRKGLVLDRYVHSLRIYHEIMLRKPLLKIIETAGLYPATKTIFLDVPVPVAMRRIGNRASGQKESFESNPVLLSAIAFQMQHTRDMVRFCPGDKNLSPAEIAEKILFLLNFQN